MRILKIFGMVIGGLVALLVLGLVAIWLFFDPNDYKDRITAAVRDSTGRSLSLPGKLKLSVFPWLAVETGEASLGNPQGFGDEPFLTLKRASMSVKLMPLLHRQLEVGRIEIDGLDLRLKQNAAGKGNWEDWGKPSEPSPAGSSGPASLDLAGVQIADSRIAFEDMVAQKVNVTIGRIAPGAAIPVEMKLELVNKPGARPMPLLAQFQLQLDLDRQQYKLAKLALRGNLQPEGAPKALDWQFESPAVELDLAAQTLAQATFNAQFGAARLNGAIAGSKLIDAPALGGSFQLAELAPRELMGQFGITPPVTRDTAALARFAARGKYAWQGGAARMSDLSLTLDESKLSGRLAYDTASSGMDFALALDRIDLDRYQPPPTNPEEKTEPIELPVEFLKPLRAKGSFTVGQIKIGGAHLTDLSAGIDIANAQARFAPLAAKLYGGTYRGNIQLDMRPAVPRLSMDEHMAGIDIAALMKEYADSQRLSGRGNLDVKLSANGRNGDALLKTLTGTVGLNLQHGAVEGIDVWYAIAQAQSLIQKRQLAAATNTKRTAFDSFSATADVVNGVATTKDLNIASQLLQITGAGSTNLVTQALDYTITTTVLKAPPDADAGTAELARARIPVTITGTFSDPKIRPDLAGMAKERVKQEVEKRKEEVQEKVKDKLKGLFGR
ncbi:MAG TPA: AsmA family protein [Steroidobacteraceae bacterium]|nr:AsmA family protein [Steroidobacteraceae bacterium]